MFDPNFPSKKLKPSKNEESAVGMWKHAIALYGYGLDLSIYDECDQTDDNYSSLGTTYEPPKDLPNAKTCLALTDKFKVNDIQVYQVIAKPISASNGNQGNPVKK